MLSGQLPFHGSTPTAVLVQIAQQEAPRLDQVAPQVPLPLAVIIGRMMARLREARYQDIGVILEDLTSYERRGLLLSSQSGTFIGAGAGAVQHLDIETQAYQPPPERMDDL
jgi:hypothetical protein